MSSPSSIPDHPVFLRASQVVERVGMSLSTVYRRVADGSFPQPRPVTPRIGDARLGRVIWIEGEVVAWQLEVVAGRPPAPGTYHADNDNVAPTTTD